ncbi:Transcriptional regulator containing an amidase domain and an AraC-type DNA-binding HTH domain [Paraburkholderia tropica]|uniref:GlxA family transcriptional regulator n=1 Tax=Paraburkholderia tropica TaxID=92647 RepID=UPI001CB1107C|nr:GlxA family transcriptional regulator [Paraburkholderia tropica]CAG9239040.1 Transcriptional regulator containing an amidase domain and an AraC-type DNA-binding HTH domain [Paraburkholderia tropica]
MSHPIAPLPSETRRPIRFGIVLLPNFTLTAFSGFVDLLRLASDDGDMSRPVRCSWTIVAETLAPIRASCGIQVTPWTTFDEAGTFDYLLVVGGLLHSGPSATEATHRFIRTAAASGATLVGICTGAFALARAGVMDGYRICVSWFHYWDFVERFPAISESNLIADRLFVIDRARITCSGGRASIDVAAAILLRHLDAAIVQKAQRILIVDDAQRGNAPQPYPPGLDPASHPKVRRAILIMEQHIANPLPLTELARRVDTSVRQLERLFVAETGKSPNVYGRQMRVRMAAWMLHGSDRTVADIAMSCGFSDASHLGREFRKEYDASPGAYRIARPPVLEDAACAAA